MLFGKKKKETEVKKEATKKTDKKVNKVDSKTKSVTQTKTTANKKATTQKPLNKKETKSSKSALASAKKENKPVKRASAPAQTEVKAGIYRVVYDKADREWKIKRDGAKRIIDSYATKEEALARVKELSDNSDVGFVVYKRDGKFQKK